MHENGRQTGTGDDMKIQTSSSHSVTSPTSDHKYTSSQGSTSTAPYAEHGALIDPVQPPPEARRSMNSRLFWPKTRHWLREPFAEFMGTFVLVMFGNGVNAQVTLSGESKGSWLTVCWGWVPPDLHRFIQ
jgi:hypothetical protein